jgi:CRP/FNR family transcriptional regulator
MPDLRRSTLLFSQGQPADSLYFLESGLVKLTRANNQGGRIILGLRGAGEIVGEEALSSADSITSSEAEVISPACAYRIPKITLHSTIHQSPELASCFLTFLLESRGALAEKVELLCLHDVEFRVLHTLQKLAAVVPPMPDGSGAYQIPITQLELADLIGATRETTSTVLNQLERRGLLQLSRRMLTVKSRESLDSALKSVHEIPPNRSRPVRAESTSAGM